MTGSFSVEGGKIVITNDGRTVSTTDGTLVNFLTTPQNYNVNAVYPDAAKAGVYSWTGRYIKVSANLRVMVWGTYGVGAVPQEYSFDYNLGAAPAGADIFLGRISLSRTVSPTHNWGSRPLTPLIPQGVYMPINGSLMVEQGFGIARAMSVYISGGSLILNVQHSVSVGSGGYRSWGPQEAPFPPPAGNVDGSGGRNDYDGGTPPLLVYSPTTSPGRKFTDFQNPGGAEATVYYTWHRRDGNDPAVYSDPTNFSSTYAVNVQGRFGRRS